MPTGNTRGDVCLGAGWIAKPGTTLGMNVWALEARHGQSSLICSAWRILTLESLQASASMSGRVARQALGGVADDVLSMGVKRCMRERNRLPC